MKLSTKRVFVIGAQRSGTSLLQMILNAHSQIAMAREAEFLVPFLKKKYVNHPLSGKGLKTFFFNYFSTVEEHIKFSYADYADYFSKLPLKKTITLKDFIDELFLSICQRKGKSIWCNKTPLFIPKIDILLTLFPNAKFIHIVRDGRDVFVSRRKNRPVDDDLVINALDWCCKLYRIARSFEKIPINNRLTIRYEDLIENPETTLRTICSLIGVDYEPTMLQFYKTSKDHLSSRHSKLIFKQINRDNKMKWKRNLTSKEINLFNVIAGHYLKKYNYEVCRKTIDFSVISMVIRSLFIGLPNKAIPLVSRDRAFKRILRKCNLSN